MGQAVSYGLYQSSAYRLPPLKGEISLPCLDHKGSIKYDKWGIPHIYASSRKDAFRLQGFVTAQHRCFQLTMAWLALNGKVSSVIGPVAKPVDIFARTCNFKGLGQSDWEWLFQHRVKHKKVIDSVSAFVEGINCWLSHPRFKVPVEFSRVLINYSPEFWSAADVMAMGRYLGIKMSPGWSTKMMATLMIQIVGRENAKWFCFDTEKVHQCPYQDTKDNVNDFYLGLKEIGKLLEPQHEPILRFKHSYFLNRDSYLSSNPGSKSTESESVTEINMGSDGASNAFVIGGDYTDTGSPLIAGDPHLALGIPNTFMQYHVTVRSEEDEDENMEWIGAQAVGMPGICMGHSQHIAMSLTVGACDTTDLFVERFEDEKSNRYQVDGEWRECQVRKEIIKINGAEDYILNVRETHHGPILDPTDFDTDIEKGPYSHLLDDDEEKKNDSNDNNNDDGEYYLRYSFCAAFLKRRGEGAVDRGPVDVMPDVFDSRSIKVAAAHIRQSSFPNLNFVLADTEGNYGWTTNGNIPIRPSLSTYHPLLPQPGWLSECDWSGYIPEEELPSNMNPQSGYVVSCNNRMVDEDKYPYYLGFGFDLGFRAKRASQLIDQQISDQTPIDREYLESMQLDVHDLSAEEMVHNVLRKKLNLEQVLRDHSVPDTLPQWVQSSMNLVIPSKIRSVDGDGKEMKEIDGRYYNDSKNREKAEYGWSVLSEWDFKYDVDSLAATIYEAFQMVLIRRIMITGIVRGFGKKQDSAPNVEEKDDFVVIQGNEERLKMADKLSDNIMNQAYNWSFCGAPRFYYKRSGPILSMLDCDSAEEDCWWIRNYGSRETLIVMSLIDAMDCIAYWSGTEDRSEWKWGSLHQIEGQHPVSAKLGPKPFNSDSYPIGGGQHSLMMFCPRYSRIAEDPLKASGAVVYRQIMDCHDWSNSRWVLPLGTSGQLASPYYANQLEKYIEGEYIPMLWEEDDVEENKVSELVCDPCKDINKEYSTCMVM